MAEDTENTGSTAANANSPATATADSPSASKAAAATAQDCLQMLRDMRDVAFATVDAQGLPHVRIIDVMIVDEGRLVFCTARGKDFYEELTATGRVAITGLNDSWQTVRLAGPVTKLDDERAWIDRIFAENPSMEHVYPGESRYVLEPFAVESGQVELFDLGREPIDRHRFEFGEAVRRHGFVITDACIGCGTCQAGCPQRCIEDGVPFLIHQDHCLHCGYCFENCPVQAIERI